MWLTISIRHLNKWRIYSGKAYQLLTLLMLAAVSFSTLSEETALIRPQLSEVSNQHGLSQNSVNSFYEDPDGFVWISTLAGINRFDGSKMLVIADPKNLFTRKPFNSVNSDEWGNYWLNGRDGLVQLSESGEKIELAQFPADEQNWANANMLVGSERLDKNNMLIFTWNGIYFFSPAEKDIFQPKSMALFHPNSLNLLSYLKAEKGYWLGTSEGLFFYKITDSSVEKVEIKNSPDDFKISSLHSLDHNQLMLTSNKGLFILSINSQKSASLTPISIETIGAATTENQQAYFSIGDKLYKYDLNAQKPIFLFALKDTISDFSEYLISSLFVDSKKLLWIGTKSHGAYIWDTKIPTFETWHVSSQESTRRLDDNKIWSIKITRQNNYLVSTGKGINLIDSTSGKVTQILNMLDVALEGDETDIFDFIEIENTLWLATQYGLIEHNLNTKRSVKHIPQDFDNKKPYIIYSLTSIDNKTIWLATDNGILTFNRLVNEFTYDRNVMTRFNATKTRHVSYQNEILWFGSKEKLFTYDLNNNKNKLIFENKKDLDDQYYPITDILVEGDVVWLSYSGDGIYGLNFNSDNMELVARYHTSTGLPDNQIFALEKRGHILWATTSQGLLRINTRNGQHTLFDHKNGLVGNEFNEGSSALLDSGELLLGSTRGLTKITPKKLLKSEPISAPRVAEAKIFDSNSIQHLWPVRDVITISEENDLLGLQLTNFDYTRANSALFEYWFDSSREIEQRYNAISRLTITDLPVGEHLLNIRSKTVNESTSSPVSQLKIIVKKTESVGTLTQIISLSLTLLLITAIGRYWYKSFEASRKFIVQIKNDRQRLELALIDEKRGVWDCKIEVNNYQLSTFTLYHHQHQPLDLSLEQHTASIHPDDLEKIKSVWLKFLSGETEEVNISYRCNFFKQWFWCSFQGKLNQYSKDGSPLRATGVWQNVDQEKNLENKLNLYSTAFESTQDIILILDNSYKILFVNKAYEFTSGFAVRDLVGKSMVDVAMQRASSRETKEIRKQLKLNSRWHGQSSIARKNAASIPIDVKINLIEKNKEKVGYVIVMSEILQAKDIENPSVKTNFYDRSTGLPSKTLAFDRLRQHIVACRESADSISLIFLGIDHFNKLKSGLRPGSMDILFAQLTSRLLPYIQKNELLARYEPDIFLIVIQHRNDESSVLHTVNQLLRELSKPIDLDEQQINISACAGISSYPDDGENWSELITKGETALAQTKQQGSNLFKYYHEDSNKKALERVALENKLSRALQESEFYLVFQPIIDLTNNQVIEFDINWRWRTDEDHTIYPSQFLPMVSELGMIREFSDWLVTNALATLHRWNEEGLSVCININLSIEYLATDYAIDLLRARLAYYKINPKFIFISILEDDPKFFPTKLESYFSEIYGLGLNMVLDDFGKKHASLKDLTSLKFHSVKFAKNMTRNIGRSKLDGDMFANLIHLMNSLNVGTVAKGIEDNSQLEYLAEHGCKCGQGYFISDPLNESQARQSLLIRQ